MSERSKWYSNRGNCIRAAKVALGKSAKPGVNFILDQEGGKYAWTAWESDVPPSERTIAAHAPSEAAAPAAPAPAKVKRTRAKKGEKSPITKQPAMQVVIGLMQRKSGMTVIDGAERTGSNVHTLRGKVSLLRTAKVPITIVRTGRLVTYFLDPEWAA